MLADGYDGGSVRGCGILLYVLFVHVVIEEGGWVGWRRVLWDDDGMMVVDDGWRLVVDDGGGREDRRR